jgi:hypothetical protein
MNEIHYLWSILHLKIDIVWKNNDFAFPDLHITGSLCRNK